MSLFIDNYLFAMSLHGQKVKGVPWNLCYKETNPIHEGTTLVYHLPKAPVANTITVGIRFQQMNFKGTQTSRL